MKRAAWLCVCLALVACGDDSKSSDRLQGNWISESDEEECATVLTIEDDLIELKLACELEDGTHAVEVHHGTFEATDKELTWTFTKSTCSDPDLRPERKKTQRYSFVGDNLRLLTDEGALVLERVEAPKGNEAGTGELEFGCFDEEGYFESSPLEGI